MDNQSISISNLQPVMQTRF